MPSAKGSGLPGADRRPAVTTRKSMAGPWSAGYVLMQAQLPATTSSSTAVNWPIPARFRIVAAGWDLYDKGTATVCTFDLRVGGSGTAANRRWSAVNGSASAINLLTADPTGYIVFGTSGNHILEKGSGTQWDNTPWADPQVNTSNRTVQIDYTPDSADLGSLNLWILGYFLGHATDLSLPAGTTDPQYD